MNIGLSNSLGLIHLVREKVLENVRVAKSNKILILIQLESMVKREGNTECINDSKRKGR